MPYLKTHGCMSKNYKAIDRAKLRKIREFVRRVENRQIMEDEETSPTYADSARLAERNQCRAVLKLVLSRWPTKQELDFVLFTNG